MASPDEVERTGFLDAVTFDPRPKDVTDAKVLREPFSVHLAGAQ